MARIPTSEPYIRLAFVPKKVPTHVRWTVYHLVNGVPAEKQGKVSLERVKCQSDLKAPTKIRDKAESLAREAAEEARQEIVRGGPILTHTLQSWCDHCATKILAVEREKRYAQQVRSQLEMHVYGKLGSVSLSKLTPAQVCAWWEWLSRTPRAAPIRNKSGTVIGAKTAKILGWKSRELIKGYLSTCLSRAVDNQLIQANPVAAIPDDKAARDAYKTSRVTRLRWFSLEELRHLLEGSRNTPLYAPILIQIDLAVRAAEACGLGLWDVDLETGRTNIVRQLARKPTEVGGPATLALCPPKGMSRPFRASEELQEIVRARRIQNSLLPEADRHPYIALNPDGKPMDPSWYSKRFRVLCEILGLSLPRGNSTHVVRRSVLNALKEAPGLSSSLLSLIAGHEREQTTHAYLEDTLTESQRTQLASAADWFQDRLRSRP